MIEPGEARLRRWVSRTLASGMALSVAIVAIGLAIGVVTGEGLAVDPPGGGLAPEIGAGKPGSIVLLGLVVLTLTPVAQLAAAALAFRRANEPRYLTITLAVLGLLLGSLVIAVVVATATGG